MKKVRTILICIITFVLIGCVGCGTSLPTTEIVQEVENAGTSAIEDEVTDVPTKELEKDAAKETSTEQGNILSSEGNEKEADSVFSSEINATEPEVVPVVPPTITLTMVGDILLHTPVEECAKRPEGGYHFDAIFANVKEEIQEADLALVNQEVIIGGEELGISGYPAFNAPYEIGDALVEAGFDVVCQGTNHALDKGKRGLLSCLAFWEESYPEIAVLGIHGSQESQDSIYVYEKDGMKIAILNYTYGTNGIALPKDMPYAVDLLEEARVVADIRKAEEMADFTIVCPHWGTEYELGISSQQKKWTNIFLEHGVDLVLGTHPHVIEPVEWISQEETGQEMLVYYSLGNFVNWTSGTGAGVANRMVGGMAQVTLEQAEDGEVFIAEYGIEPVVCHVESGMDGVTVYFLEEYTAELAGQNEIVQQDANFSLEYCEQLCEQVWGEQ